MPSKKPGRRRKPWDDRGDQDAGFFGDQVVAADSRMGGTGAWVGTEAERVVIGLPLPAFSQQYLVRSDVYPLGRMAMFVGESGSCKSAFLSELIRWHLRDWREGADPKVAVGRWKHILAEARDVPDLRASIVGRELINSSAFQLTDPCQSIEEWQDHITNCLLGFDERFDKGAFCWPAGIGLDSINGVTSQKVIDGIEETGHAELNYAIDANLINTYSKFIFAKIHNWPLSFVCTNHIRFQQDKFGNKIRHIPGCLNLRYNSTFIFDFKLASKPVERAGYTSGRKLTISTLKNLGDHSSLEVEMVWYHDEQGQQHTTWDWHGASIELLTSFTGNKGKEIQELTGLVRHPTQKSVTSTKLGMKKATSFNEAGKILSANPAFMRQLRVYFGIQERGVFRPGVPYSQQIEEAKALGHVTTHNESEGAEAPEEEKDG